MSEDGQDPAAAATAAPRAQPPPAASAAVVPEVRLGGVSTPRDLEEGVVAAFAAPQAVEGEADAAVHAPAVRGLWKERPEGLVLVPTGHHFVHRACLNRALGLLVAYVALAVAGWWLASSGKAQGGKALGLAILTVGPLAIIIATFYSRYRLSATKRQTCITFVEAIFWMVPLLCLVIFIDPLNAKLTMPVQEVECTWPGVAGSRILADLSWLAQCSKWAADPNNSTPLAQHASESCMLLQRGKMTTQVVIDASGSFQAAVLEQLLHVAYPAVGPLHCAALEVALRDLQPTSFVSVSEVERGSCSLRIGSRDALTSAAAEMRRESCQGDGTFTFRLQPTTIANAFVTAYIRAGFLEELLKFFAVRRILFKDRVASPGGLIVYGLAAGAGFATVENIEYTIAGGIHTAIARMVLSIPLHCCTGLIIGIQLGYRKFLGRAFPCPLMLLIPVLVHGTYNFVLMLPASVGLPQKARMAAVTVILLGAVAYCRCIWLRLEDVCVVDVRALQAAGWVSAPRSCCRECDCCVPIFVHKDPMTAAARKSLPTRPRQQKVDERNGKSRPETNDSMHTAGLARTLSDGMARSLPQCQTEPVRCLGCGADVWAHVFFPSYCPHCGARMTNELRHRSGIEEHTTARTAV